MSDLPILGIEKFKDFYDVEFNKMEVISELFLHVRYGKNKVDKKEYVLK